MGLKYSRTIAVKSTRTSPKQIVNVKERKGKKRGEKQI